MINCKMANEAERKALLFLRFNTLKISDAPENGAIQSKRCKIEL